MMPYVLEEETFCLRSDDSGERGGEVGSFGDGVHNDHHCVMTRGLWELDDEVHADCLTGADGTGRGCSSPIGKCL